MCFAVSGSSSQIRVPGTDVWIALNGPPVSVFGFGSHDSSWLSPPSRKTTSTRFCALESSFAAAGLANPPRPGAAVAPSDVPRNDRRETVWSAVREAYVQGSMSTPQYSSPRPLVATRGQAGQWLNLNSAL